MRLPRPRRQVVLPAAEDVQLHHLEDATVLLTVLREEVLHVGLPLEPGEGIQNLERGSSYLDVNRGAQDPQPRGPMGSPGHDQPSRPPWTARRRGGTWDDACSTSHRHARTGTSQLRNPWLCR